MSARLPPASDFLHRSPYVIDEIVDKGTPQQRAAALRTKAVDNTFRALRLATKPRGSRPNGRPRALR